MPCKVDVVRKRAIQMKATKKTFPILFIILYKVVLTFESVTTQMKATEQYFHLVLFIMLYKVLVVWIDYLRESHEQYFPVVVFA